MSEKLLEIHDRRGRRRFIELVRDLYRGDPRFVPPLAREELKILDPVRNPFYRQARTALWVLTGPAGDRGRISATIHPVHDRLHGERAGFFGHFEAADAAGATRLLDRAATWLAEQGAATIRGPISPSINHKAGLLVEGFDGPPVVEMPYNPPVYATWLEGWGLAPVKDLLSFLLRREVVRVDRLESLGDKVRRRGRLTSRQLDMRAFHRDLERIRMIFNEAWSENWGFLPLEPDAFRYQAASFKPLVQPRLCRIVERDGEAVGFILMIPDVNIGLKSCDGRLLPWGWLKLLAALRRPTRGRVILLGVKPEFRNQGVEVLLMGEVIRHGVDLGYREADLSWILEDNRAMLGPLEKIGARLWRRFRVYEKGLG